jgi:hypothetical protein
LVIVLTLSKGPEYIVHVVSNNAYIWIQAQRVKKVKKNIEDVKHDMIVAHHHRIFVTF